MSAHPLAAVLDTAAAQPLRSAILNLIERSQPVLLDGSAVERAGLACLQVIVAGRIAAEGEGLAFRVERPSPALIEMAALAGITPRLQPLA